MKNVKNCTQIGDCFLSPEALETITEWQTANLLTDYRDILADVISDIVRNIDIREGDSFENRKLKHQFEQLSFLREHLHNFVRP